MIAVRRRSQNIIKNIRMHKARTWYSRRNIIPSVESSVLLCYIDKCIGMVFM